GDPGGAFLATAGGEPASRRPVWIMRQAGRHLPEYRALRERHAFLELCQTPELAATATLQPLERYDLDAAILFTDLLVPVVPMGVGLAYEPGPVLERTIRDRAAVESLRIPDPQEELAPMLETARLVRERLDPGKALIGFVGAPFTVACYLVEGRGSKSWDATRRLMYASPETFDALLERIAAALEPLARALVGAGCDAVQVFDSWASVLDADDYRTRCAPFTQRLVSAVQREGGVAIDYVNGAAQHLETLGASRADIVAFDWRVPMHLARRRLPEHRVVQGNLDPTLLFAPRDALRRRVRELCAAAT